MACPYGAVPTPDGVRFRLWAPAATSVAVVLEPAAGGPADTTEAPRTVPLDPADGGWFAAVVPDTGPGTLYRYQIDGDLLVPDPASAFQPRDVAGPSMVVDHGAYPWQTTAWSGRPWHETVLYELHVGTFSPEGSYDGLRARLPALKALGITAIELMPLSDFPGARNWGYDGVLPFAPDSAYGTPDDLKQLIDAAHGEGLQVFLDVVYNHFGPEGNYLHAYAPDFFTDAHQTPWGAAIDFSRAPVRGFFIENALHWLTEYRFDGLRFDAVHAITDDGEPHMLDELARTIRQRLPVNRLVHLVLENDANQARWLSRDAQARPVLYTAQWNDDFHHVAHVLATGESDGYYGDHADDVIDRFGRCLAEGFDYQGSPSVHRDGNVRGEPSGHLPATAFVSFLQNHDQTGNRALGERLSHLAPTERRRALAAVLLLAPSVPMLFMGEEWGSEQPFLFFCGFEGDLADAVREGRRREFAQFPQFQDPAMRERIPDPIDPSTAERCVLDWTAPEKPAYKAWLELTRELLELRHREIIPLLPLLAAGDASWETRGRFLSVHWPLTDGRVLTLDAAFGEDGEHPEHNPEDGCNVLWRSTDADWRVLWCLRSEEDTQ